MADGRGLPLLSGIPPPVEAAEACRKCSKEFNMFLNRSRKCYHCGYSYCHNCSDYQALMPRTGQETGYDSMNVCAYCIEFLTITAGGRGYLKSLPLGKLKKYVDAYNIKIDRAVEKDDLIDGIISARNGNGCLSREKENYYRKYSVPDRSNSSNRNRGFFSRSGQGSNNAPPPPPPRPASQPASYSFPRPDLAPDTPSHHQRPHYPPPPGPPPHHQYHRPPTPPRPQYNPPPPVPPRQDHYNSYNSSPPRQPGYHNTPPYHHNPNQYPPHYTSPPPTPPHASRPRQHEGPYHNPPASRSSQSVDRSSPGHTSPRPRTASAAPPPTVPPPSLDELLDMTTSAIASLPISSLKAILFTNHVNAGLILEKGELVSKVRVLVEDEKRERERQRALEEQEEADRIEMQRVLLEQHKQAQRGREERDNVEKNMDTDQSDEAGPGSSAPPPPPKARGTAADLERTGLCVICQDDEANIAIVDCGHLAMCRSCSDLVMSSSRECPLCRTRIVTEARLLRIFKT